jgi:hypothetical protein
MLLDGRMEDIKPIRARDRELNCPQKVGVYRREMGDCRRLLNEGRDLWSESRAPSSCVTRNWKSCRCGDRCLGLTACFEGDGELRERLLEL